MKKHQLTRLQQFLHGRELDSIPELMAFADKLEKACIYTIENGEMTGDLYLISTLENKKKLNTEDFIMAIRKTLEGLM